MQHKPKAQMERGSSPQAIKRHRIFDQVAQNLEAMILSGELKVGDSLPSERALMERFEVGRPAIREASSGSTRRASSPLAMANARVLSSRTPEISSNICGPQLYCLWRARTGCSFFSGPGFSRK